MKDNDWTKDCRALWKIQKKTAVFFFSPPKRKIKQGLKWGGVKQSHLALQLMRSRLTLWRGRNRSSKLRYSKLMLSRIGRTIALILRYFEAEDSSARSIFYSTCYGEIMVLFFLHSIAKLPFFKDIGTPHRIFLSNKWHKPHPTSEKIKKYSERETPGDNDFFFARVKGHGFASSFSSFFLCVMKKSTPTGHELTVLVMTDFAMWGFRPFFHFFFLALILISFFLTAQKCSFVHTNGSGYLWTKIFVRFDRKGMRAPLSKKHGSPPSSKNSFFSSWNIHVLIF